MTIVQLSDLHTEEPGSLAYNVADTIAMTYQAVRHIKSLRQSPDLVMVTGDLSSDGKAQGYMVVRDALNQLHVPAYVLPGNHDDREQLMKYLSPWCPAESKLLPSLCYTVEKEDVRIIALDTTAPHSHSGHITPKVANWLDSTLSQDQNKPALVFMHHPPVFVGMKFMDESFEGLDMLAGVVRKHPQVQLCCGHMHRSFITEWEGRLLAGCPATSMQMEVDLSEKGGDAFFMEAPGYALHTLQYGRILTFFCQITSQPSFSGPHPFLGVGLV